ncbi:MAG TPA: type II secretion system protein E, partial [Persephonella sp.]|nr:type II secretion system protein E [Persephonella sp.]
MYSKPIGQLLRELGYISEKHIEIALEIQKIKKSLLGEILIELGFVSSKETAQAIATQAEKPYIDLIQYPPSQEALSTLPKEIAKQLGVIPFDVTKNSVKIAVSNPFDVNAIDILKRRYYGIDIEIYVSDKETILKYIEIYYFLLENPIDEEIDKSVANSLKGNTSLEIPRLLELILDNAILNRATDIHISPENIASHVFYRIDGIMTHYHALPKKIHGSIVSRVKILADLDIAEQRVPQDGAFSHEFFGEQYDFRVSTVPTAYGENVVIRVLSKNISLYNLRSLGFEKDIYEKIEEQFLKPQGIVLVTGPTGSGKTTTLYAALRRINALEKNILTVEDPIEYRFPFIKQTQVNEKAGYTFARAIRAFLRQDPDVILVGEIRDEETAEMA